MFLEYSVVGTWCHRGERYPPFSLDSRQLYCIEIVLGVGIRTGRAMRFGIQISAGRLASAIPGQAAFGSGASRGSAPSQYRPFAMMQ